MSRMVEVVIDSIRVSLTNQQRIVVLREVNAERYLTIWIGPYEAEAITIALQEIEVARPQTHDLLKNVIQQFKGRLSRVEVVDLREDVFYGNLVIEMENGQTMTVDSRPSDALALAVRSHAPILVARSVMDAAGVVPESDIQDQEAAAPLAPTASPEEDEGAAETPTNESRLSVFEDFLQGLDLDDLNTPSGDEDQPDEGKPDKGKR